MDPLSNHNVEQLIMLLSADWFLPYWSVLGITVGESKRSTIQEGCRKLTKIIQSAPATNSTSEYLEGKNQVMSTFRSLISSDECARNALKEWEETSHEDLTASWFFLCLGIEVLRQSSIEGHELRNDIRSIVIPLYEKYGGNEIDFSQLCLESESAWDVSTRNLTPDIPTSLADSLQAFIWLRQFKAFWDETTATLEKSQKMHLLDWYQKVARSRAGREIQPSFF